MSGSLWMYKSSVNPSIIHLSPFLLGIILLSLNNGIRDGAKEQKKVSFYLTIASIFVFLLLIIIPNNWKEEGFTTNIIIMLVMAVIVVLYEVSDRLKKTKAR
jgi:isoprenylcysteine carboxyl methyltransferase (ICMT) family protein YpbQ